jgi:predicted Fe-S protein YdhL (DUF1289 family)
VHNLNELFAQLARSKFRNRFRLRESELSYLNQKGLEEVLAHASQFIEQRLARAYPVNDGKQTPFRNHPVFVAQHATATCCRGCLQKWHGIKQGRELSAEEKQYILSVLRRWLSSTTTSDPSGHQPDDRKDSLPESPRDQ